MVGEEGFEKRAKEKSLKRKATVPEKTNRIRILNIQTRRQSCTVYKLCLMNLT